MVSASLTPVVWWGTQTSKQEFTVTCMGRGVGVQGGGAPKLLGHRRISRGSDTSARTQRTEVGGNLPLLRNHSWSMLGREVGTEAGKTAGLYP